ncbi:DUF6508 domain-containing protein [Persicitalea sp.]|uniref:DUF6508 domain-containing protein n=1 Tax=Persicitalea sp. TaxID=3100273 RepID=UPI0035945D7B
MIDIEDFQAHLSTLKKAKWAKLFELLPHIESSAEFGKVEGGEVLNHGSIKTPYWTYSDLVRETVRIIHDLQITPIFDWPKWEEGHAMLEDRAFDYSALDTTTLCKLLTTIIRTDRFNDGFLVLSFQSGTMAKIIRALQENVSSGK